MKARLPLREWLVIFLILGFMLCFVCTAFFSKVRIQRRCEVQWQHIQAQKLEIEIVGAVRNPGKYMAHPGTTLKQLLQEVGLTRAADRKQINFKKVFYVSERIEIPSKPKK